MTGAARRVDVLVCTFRRPAIAATLASVDGQRLDADVDLRVVVADNDETPSGQDVVAGKAATMAVPVHYVHAPSRNISIARNACLDAADADWVAFLDDDEVAEPDWLAHLLACAAQTGADGVFGPAVSEYGPGAPAWMRRQDHHSNRPVRRGDTVETGHTCNALLRWRGAPWQQERFDLERGTTGGEDTAFFFRLRRAGARYAICDAARVREPVAPERLTLRWLLRRKFRAGQSHAASAVGPASRTRLGASALGKAGLCGVACLAFAASTDRRSFWFLRAALHVGVVAGCLSLAQPRLYGADAGGQGG